MSKIVFVLLLIFSNSYASTKAIENKIKSNEDNLNKSLSKKKETSLKVRSLANKINIQNKNIIKLERNIKKVNSDISEHQKLLQ